jgi:hypothetical protein
MAQTAELKNEFTTHLVPNLRQHMQAMAQKAEFKNDLKGLMDNRSCGCCVVN